VFQKYDLKERISVTILLPKLLHVKLNRPGRERWDIKNNSNEPTFKALAKAGEARGI